MDERNQLILFSKYANNFSIATGVLIIILIILFFFILEKKKLDKLSILILLTSIFSVFVLGLIDKYDFSTDRYNYLFHIPRFREEFYINGIKDIFVFRSSNNSSLIYSFLPLPAPKTLLDFGLFVKCIYLALILFLISKNFEKKKNIILFLIYFPLFHFYSGLGSKECLVFVISYFWSQSLVNRRILVNLICGFIFTLVKYEFGFLILLSSFIFFVLQLKILRSYLLLILVICLYFSSYYVFDRYIDFINYKFRGFHTESVWLPMYNFNDFLIRLIFSYFTSPLKILNLQNISYINISFSITIILGYIYFYYEILKLKKLM